MVAAHTSWTVLPHGSIEKLADNLWRVPGELPGMTLGRVMTIARRDDGRLLIHNAIALEEAAMAEIEAWGEPAWLVVPNGWHRLDAPSFRQRYPRLQVVAPSGSRKRIERVVPVDLTYDAFPSDEVLELRHLPGTRDREGVLRARSADGQTLVFNDVVFNVPDHLPGLSGLVLRVIGSTGGPTVTKVGRLFIVADRKAFRAELERLAATPDLRRVIVSHGEIEASDPAGMLRRVAGGL